MIIGICGGTGSGKTTIARRVIESVGRENVILVEQDSYYRNLADMPLDERHQANFDHLDAFDNGMLVNHLKRLKQGQSIEMPVYDYKNHVRSEEFDHLEPKPVIVVEGILIFNSKALRDLFDIKVFVHADADERLIRRVRRDIEERGRDINEVLGRYQSTLKPMHQQFIEPTKTYADIIIPNDRYNTVAIDIVRTVISNKL